MSAYIHGLWALANHWAEQRLHLASCRGPGCCGCCRGELEGHPGEAYEMARALPAEHVERVLAWRPVDPERAVCPLLHEGRCLVYRARPVICRTRLVCSPPELCDPDLGPAQVAILVDAQLEALSWFLEPRVALLPQVQVYLREGRAWDARHMQGVC